MVNPVEIEGYACVDCGKFYKSSSDAMSCCPKETELIFIYECSKCFTVYENKHNAERCCNHE